ncbi:TetR family transcriptional regulator [Wenjunlia vitaminophila]|uniref:TetR family transcriptional regulator n=1 Tax=Wenjunlia vitaminophila TaxID=76728 RepID=A0A0T6LQY8_WENVI|nr:TetR/AcrR family transcriptional regulator [Wenjunlia vitaminophila]KRV48255.1 TetR family transcriptional regulator [Wenjunlia vitaminophila]
MSPRRASVNEEMRRRSRERLLQATIDLVSERGYDEITLGDIAERAGAARGLVSYYFPSKRHLLQSAVHRLMNMEVAGALEAAPPDACGPDLLARLIDCILALATDRPTLFRSHMASILAPDTAGFVQCPEQQRLARLMEDTLARSGVQDPEKDYPMLRALLMGAVVGLLLPGAEMPLPRIRTELFRWYGLDWELGVLSATVPPPA